MVFYYVSWGYVLTEAVACYDCCLNEVELLTKFKNIGKKLGQR